MNLIRLLTSLLLVSLAQGALATTIWLKDRGDQVCKNSASANPGQIIGLGGVTRAGAITFTISNPAGGILTPNSLDCQSIPTTPVASPIVFSGTLQPQIVPIHMVKPGTKGALECLDQGNNYSGVSGQLVSGIYRLIFAFSYTDGCTTGNPLPAFSRSLTLRQGQSERPRFVGKYHIFRDDGQGNPIDEPGTLLLMAAGAAGLISFAMKRRQRNHKQG